VFHEFCYRLWLHLESFRGRPAVALFASRGGLALQALFETFLRHHDLDAPIPLRPFYVSRLAAAKATLARRPREATAVITREFRQTDLRALLTCVVPFFRDGWDLSSYASRPVEEFGSVLEAGHGEVPRAATDYFARQHRLLDAYLAERLDGSQIPLLVDTGWAGTTQALLMAAWPQFEWLGLYFARWNYWGEVPAHFPSVIGVWVDSLASDSTSDRAAVFDHRHLVEGMLEVPTRSVEEYRGTAGRVIPDVATDVPPLSVTGAGGELLQGVIRYLETVPRALEPGAIVERADRSSRELARAIRRPSLRDVTRLDVGARSEDFGKAAANRVLLPPAATPAARRENCRSALWRQGQVRLEFGAMAAPRLWREAIQRRRGRALRRWQSASRVLQTAATTDRADRPADPVLARLAKDVRRSVRRLPPAGRRRVALFGASAYGDYLVQLLQSEGCGVVCFYDNSAEKVGTTRAGLAVRPPAADSDVSAVVIASVSHRAVLRRQVDQIFGTRRVGVLP
jgi:hypothetical protein